MLRWKRTKHVASWAVRKRMHRLAEELLFEFPQYDLTQESPEVDREWEFVADLSALQSQLAGGMYWRRGDLYQPARAEVISEVQRMHRLALNRNRFVTATKLAQIRTLLEGRSKSP
ncbi:hypothetical protein ACFDTO_08495 [Microbacteriaceae bacterium 4G12]